MTCKICKSEGRLLGEAKVLGKHSAEYIRCGSCGFIFAKDPHWLAEAYSSAITSSDLGTVSRANQCSLITKAIIDVFFNETKDFLDYGAGYGVFVRRMRDLGYNFSAYDVHCENLFAPQFQVADLTGKKFDLTTAYEVFEHLEEPMSVFDQILGQSDNLLISTLLVPNPVPAFDDWWYFGLEHGQHVSLYSIDTMKFVAAKHGRYFYTDYANLHFFSRKKLSYYWFRRVTGERTSQVLGLWRRRKSLLIEDFNRNRERIMTEKGYKVTSVLK